MPEPLEPHEPRSFLHDVAGECAALVRRMDWRGHRLGPVAGWPQSLKTLVSTVLENGFAMGLAWGHELALIYNDAFVTVLGPTKHPMAMGAELRAVFPEAWEIIGPLLQSALGGRGVALTDLLVPIEIDGKVDEHYFTFSYAPVRNEQGAVAGVLITFTETTARWRAEARWREALREAQHAREDLHDFFNQAPLPMCILSGPEHVFTLVNPAYARMIGRPLMGLRVRDAFSADEVEYYLPILDRVYRTGEPFVVRESPLALSNGRGGVDSLFVDVGYHPYRDAQGQPRGVLAIVQDVTESVTARRAAEESNRLKDEFLATMSHELRTPLNAVLGWTAMLRSGAIGEDKRTHALETIERNARSQVAIVEDILDVSRISVGQLRLELVPTPLAPLVQAALQTVRPAAEAKGVALRVAIDASQTTVLGNGPRLEQVAWNLLNNAVKFTPRGGRVEVTLARDGAHVVLQIADTGQGISPAFLPYVFDRFRQADSGTTRAHGGLGLGLAIARQLVELHGGTLAVESAGLGLGASFTVRLPARDAATDPAG